MQSWSVIQQALLISVIGIVLIFAVLLMMWGMMAILVRVTAPRRAATVGAPVTVAAAGDAAAAERTAARRRAAAAAVAIALALEAERDAAVLRMQQAQGAISPWQATIRGNVLSRRASVFRRNPPHE